jgi:outer membrane protein OmpA-like peptidoglycan-associated protein
MMFIDRLCRSLFVVAVAAAITLATIAQVSAAECPGAGQDTMIVLFDYDSSEVKGDYQKTLKQWAARAKNRLVVCIVGWADKKGNAEYNKKLSLRRAEAVAKFLEQEGLGRSVMDIRSKGEALGQGMADVETKSKQARRVEISYGR